MLPRDRLGRPHSEPSITLTNSPILSASLALVLPAGIREKERRREAARSRFLKKFIWFVVYLLNRFRRIGFIETILEAA